MRVHGAWPPCMAVATLSTSSQAKHAHKVVRIRTSKPSRLRKRLPIVHHANFIDKKHYVKIFNHFNYLMHSYSLLKQKSVLPAASAHNYIAEL